MTEQNTLNINIKSEENTMAIDITAKINFKMSNLLHLCTIKSPTSSAFIGSKGNSYHALEKCEGVKVYIFAYNNVLSIRISLAIRRMILFSLSMMGPLPPVDSITSVIYLSFNFVWLSLLSG